MITKKFILIIVCVFIGLSLANPIGVPAPKNQPVLKDSSPNGKQTIEKEIIKTTPNILDHSIGVLNVVASLTGALVGLITLIIIVAIAVGVFEVRRWQKIRKQLEIYRDEAKKCVNEMKPILEKIKKDTEEVSNLRKSLPQISLLEKPSAEIRMKLNEFAQKIEFLEKFGIPLKAQDYISRGDDFFYKDNFKDALNAFEKAIEIESDNIDAWFKKSIVLGMLKQYKEALIAIHKVKALSPNFTKAISAEALYLLGLGDYDNALEIIKKLLEKNPNDANALEIKCLVLSKQEKYKDALEVINKAIELNQNNADFWYDRACLYALMENKSEALKNLEKAIFLDKDIKSQAKTDEDFKSLWNDNDFKKLVD